MRHLANAVGSKKVGGPGFHLKKLFVWCQPTYLLKPANSNFFHLGHCRKCIIDMVGKYILKTDKNMIFQAKHMHISSTNPYL